jgi:toxin ParE1/3/4
VRIIWSPTAVRDLNHARAYIAQRNPTAARNVAQTIRRAVRRLADFPASGRPGRLPNTRELVVTGTPFVVPYRVVGDRIEIVAVLHRAR